MCDHLGMIELGRPTEDDKEGAVCADCVRDGSRWVHLRICRTCGHVACCDSSPKRHARRHFDQTAHPIISSMEPGERWSYCWVDDEMPKV